MRTSRVISRVSPPRHPYQLGLEVGDRTGGSGGEGNSLISSWTTVTPAEADAWPTEITRITRNIYVNVVGHRLRRLRGLKFPLLSGLARVFSGTNKPDNVKEQINRTLTGCKLHEIRTCSPKGHRSGIYICSYENL